MLALPSAILALAANLTDIHISVKSIGGWSSLDSLPSFILCLRGSIPSNDKWLHAFGDKSLSDDNLVLPNLDVLRVTVAFVDGKISQLMRKVLNERLLKLERSSYMLVINALISGSLTLLSGGDVFVLVGMPHV